MKKKDKQKNEHILFSNLSVIFRHNYHNNLSTCRKNVLVFLYLHYKIYHLPFGKNLRHIISVPHLNLIFDMPIPFLTSEKGDNHSKLSQDFMVDDSLMSNQTW